MVGIEFCVFTDQSHVKFAPPIALELDLPELNFSSPQPHPDVDCLSTWFRFP